MCIIIITMIMPGVEGLVSTAGTGKYSLPLHFAKSQHLPLSRVTPPVCEQEH